jgi:hypothetical protein
MRSTLLLTLLLAGCAAKTPPQAASVASSSSVYLRNSFDTDPSSYLGRFVPAGATDIDESSAMSLACSSHISYKFIEGGDVTYTEALSVGTDVGVRLGIPAIASANGSYAAARTAQAQYVLTGKMVAHIADPAAFAACCKSQPDQCSDRYIGEFIQGTGALYHTNTSAVKGSASAKVVEAANLDASVDLATSSDWKRAAEFTKPVYFAFKVTRTPYAQGAVNTCPAWATNPPVVQGGTYVVGNADDAKSEQGARDAALKNANVQAMRAAGVNATSLAGGTLALRAESWCVTPVTNDRGTRYGAKVLAFLADESVATAKAEAAVRISQMQAEAERFQQQDGSTATPSAPAPGTPAPGTPAPGTPTPRAPAPGTPTPGGPAPGGPDAARLVAAVQAEAFSDGRLAAIAALAPTTRITAAEAAQLLGLLGFSADMLQGLRLLRTSVVDPQNWETIVGAFSFDSDRDAARALRP